MIGNTKRSPLILLTLLMLVAVAQAQTQRQRETLSAPRLCTRGDNHGRGWNWL